MSLHLDKTFDFVLHPLPIRSCVMSMNTTWFFQKGPFNASLRTMNETPMKEINSWIWHASICSQNIARKSLSPSIFLRF
jgi:hypothetical protein